MKINNKKILLITLIIVIISLNLSSCFNYREVNQVTFVTGVVFDLDENNNVVIYTDCIKPHRNANQSSDSGKRILYKGIGETTLEAIRDINIASSYKINFTQNRAIIFTEYAAKQGLNRFIDLINNDQEFQMKPYMFVYNGDIKELLLAFNHIDEYDGYQIIAEIWKDKLTEDAEITALTDFYTAGRTRVPLMVTKGSGKTKREEQDGWVGSIVPTELIMKQLFAEEVSTIEEKEVRLPEIDAELAELVEAAKVEESDEEVALSEALNDKEEAFTIGAIRSLLKEAEKGSTDYTLLKKVEGLLNEKTTLNRDVKKLHQELKETTENRIETLTSEEIDNLMHEKWFGTLVSNIIRLIENPLLAELAILEQLQDRYSETLSTLEDESKQLEQELEEMMQQLVVRES